MRRQAERECIACVNRWDSAPGGSLYFKNFLKQHAPRLMPLSSIRLPLTFKSNSSGDILSYIIPPSLQSALA
eukprot:1489740-Karenia_brevis.AAC.1